MARKRRRRRRRWWKRRWRRARAGVGWTGDGGWWVNHTPPLVHNYALIALFSS